ncbi:hypothetical protein AS850_14465 [Frondihabitans sp. 762G35]|uniref:hypothetical protein n=1 Tax=Frondihabitans sp. 762G35 TaxID=1446794 RepID=UPI000D219883|nr:hypothetical protein [Frondihabitans sp. 762G35]ARC58286.1 hypothetical protein AS850_14465 [Frondihabitans sp. 762G35]
MTLQDPEERLERIGSLDAAGLRHLADGLGDLAASVPGVLRVQPRPGVARLARRVMGGLAVAVTTGAGMPSLPDVDIVVSKTETLVELDVVVDGEHPGPVVARTVAAALIDRLALEALPAASVDVRIVSVVS